MADSPLRQPTFLALAMLLLAPTVAVAQTGRQYDSSGRSAGRTEGQARQRQYDSMGRSETRGDTTRHKSVIGSRSFTNPDLTLRLIA